MVSTFLAANPLVAFQIEISGAKHATIKTLDLLSFDWIDQLFEIILLHCKELKLKYKM